MGACIEEDIPVLRLDEASEAGARPKARCEGDAVADNRQSARQL